jgi:N-acetylglucosaminylphosphatidylinositol deacetylase
MHNGRNFVALRNIFGMWIVISILLVVLSIGLPAWLNSRRRVLSDLLTQSGDIAVVFAHPDDEVMFFLPLILLAKELGVRVRLLCMSTGNYDGLGSIRTSEFKAVAKALGVTSADILDNQDLPDGPIKWVPAAVSTALSAYLSTHPSVTSIFTFDSYGISGHPNHISVHEGMVEYSKTSSAVAVYTLTSLPMWRKYIPILDFLITAFTPSTRLVAVNTQQPFLSLELMKLYESQNVWFRKLYCIFSRYSYINQFEKLVSS